MRILILYFSGAGSTRKVAQMMYHTLKEYCDAEIHSIEDTIPFDINDFDAMIIGTPVYHGAPSHMIMDYFDQIKPLKQKTPVFLFNTRALWSCNTNRILAKHIKPKNMITIMNRNYRSPASDGILLAPYIKRFYQFQKNIVEAVTNDCNQFIQLLHANHIQERLRQFHLGSILNAPNKFAGQHTTFPVYIHKNKCKQCSYCIKNCPQQALHMAADGYPVWDKEKCINCYRCIHHCPAKALSLSKHKTPEKL